MTITNTTIAAQPLPPVSRRDREFRLSATFNWRRLSGERLTLALNASVTWCSKPNN